MCSSLPPTYLSSSMPIACIACITSDALVLFPPSGVQQHLLHAGVAAPDPLPVPVLAAVLPGRVQLRAHSGHQPGARRKDRPRAEAVHHHSGALLRECSTQERGTPPKGYPLYSRTFCSFEAYYFGEDRSHREGIRHSAEVVLCECAWRQRESQTPLRGWSLLHSCYCL